MINLQTLDLDYFKRIAQRVTQEKADAAKKIESPKIEVPAPELFVGPKLPYPREAAPKSGYIYVPNLGLYISKEKHHFNTNWDLTKEILHLRGRRMPTIPEFIEFVNYLESDEGNSKVKNANAILEDIYKNRLLTYHGEWLDAKFVERDDGSLFESPYEMFVQYHSFDNGKIIQKEEKLEEYLAEEKTPGIDLESWLNNPTKQGLPKLNCKPGKTFYWPPKEYKIARFTANFNDYGLQFADESTNSSISIGTRYVELVPGVTQ